MYSSADEKQTILIRDFSAEKLNEAETEQTEIRTETRRLIVCGKAKREPLFGQPKPNFFVVFF
ncbi:hypothetical protein KU06062659_1680004 [Flavobacterium psychrophilum]|nr:hypothetical protein FPN184_contig00007-0002 [Flavobacterium psychrophilum]SNB10382.1 hypothetical protein KU06062659_1680004 [Flavobacterium psychrophilum]